MNESIRSPSDSAGTAKGGAIIVGTIILIAGTLGSAICLLLLFLVAYARVLVSHGAHESRSLFATAVMREIQSSAHRLLQNDPEYRHRLFERYAPLLRQEMAELLRSGFSLRTVFWYTCFRCYYSVLSWRRTASLLGLERDGLRILLATAQRGWQTSR